MNLSKEQLKRSPSFHTINPSDLEGLQEHVEWLEALLHNPCKIEEENGGLFLLEVRHLVTRVNGLKIEIFSNEHPPPHFHVSSPNLNASFSIEDCSLLSPLKKPPSAADLNKIKYWHKYAKPLLIETWNSTRPISCTVGEYSGS